MTRLWTSSFSKPATSRIGWRGSSAPAPAGASSASSATSSRGWRRGGEHRVGPGGRQRPPRRGRDRDRRQAPRPRKGPLGDPRRWSSLDRGCPRAGEDADREIVRRGPGPLVPSHPVHAGPAACGYHGDLRVRPQDTEVLERRKKRGADDATMEGVKTPDEVRARQAAIEDVHVEPAVEGYMVDIVAATRAHGQVDVGASPRGSLALLKVSRARAAIAGPDFVTPDDVKAVAMPALAHRIILKPDPWFRGGRTSAGPPGVLRQSAVPKGAC